jgi:K+-sensing histidine kinase KdpD
MVRAMTKRSLFELPLLQIEGDKATPFHGLAYPLPQDCEQCVERPCTTFKPSRTLRICDRGFAFVRATAQLCIVGLAISDLDTSKRHEFSLEQKRQYRWRRKESANEVSESVALRAAQNLESLIAEIDDRIEASLEVSRAESIDVAALEQSAIELVARKFERTHRAASHDVRQLLSSIIQEMDLVFYTRYSDTEAGRSRRVPTPSVLTAQTAAEVWRREKAVTIAAELCVTRLNAISLLLGSGNRAPATYSPHRTFTKFIRISEASIAEKSLRVDIGDARMRVECMFEMADVVAQALIDNAVKYAPANSSISVEFSIVSKRFVVSVSSYGPQILPEEFDEIFAFGRRGKQAERDFREMGTGVGLWLAKLAASDWAHLTVEQDSVSVRGSYRTTFRVIHTGSFRSEMSY